MKILIVHNRYQGRGGEDTVFEQEVELLSGAGHDVETLIVSNDAIGSLGSRIRTTMRTANNPEGVRAVTLAIDRFRPDVVHVHNFFPLLSPAVFDACRERQVPAVATLHNYRTICVGGMLLRDGRICHKCLDSTNMWGVLHRCYRKSVVGSAAVARMISHHQRHDTWTRPGLRLIALSHFAREMFVSAGFRREMIEIKPNFLPDPGDPDAASPRQGILYVGRLSPEKGLDVLLQAAAEGGFPLRVAGEGPELALLRSKATPNVQFLGRLARDAVLTEMSRAKAVVVPSLWYEGFPLVVVEAFSLGTPVIASRIGSLAEVVRHDGTGLLFQPGNVNALAQSVNRMLSDGDFSTSCGLSAREEFLAKYRPGPNLIALESIYRAAMRLAVAL